MNTDTGFFHLVSAVRSMRPNHHFARAFETTSEDEPKLPEIDYALLNSVSIDIERWQRDQGVRPLWPVGIAESLLFFVLPVQPDRQT